MPFQRKLFTVLIPMLTVVLLGRPGSVVTAQDASPVASPVAVGALQFDIQFNDTILAADASVGFQLGDRIVLNDLVLLDGTQVGHNGGVCTVTDAVGGEMFCAVTWSLPDGTISTQFLNTAPPEKVFAITGGTGAYQGAQGIGVLVEHGDETGTVSFELAE